MTTRVEKVVADDILGKLSRKLRDLFTRVETGGVNPERAFFGIKIGAENQPEPKSEGCTLGTYILESLWSYDNFHREYATLTFEGSDVESGIEGLVGKNPSLYSSDDKWLIGQIRAVYNAQVPTHGSHKMLRLYRVVRENWFGYSPSGIFDGRLEREDLMLNLCLKPVCDFDLSGNPIPCKIESGKK